MQLTACQPHHVPHVADDPVKVEAIEGLAVNRVTMTERAIAPIDLKTDSVREQKVSRSTSLPKSRSTFGIDLRPEGSRPGYIPVPSLRTFVKHKVDVAYVEGDLAVLNDGPARWNGRCVNSGRRSVRRGLRCWTLIRRSSIVHRLDDRRWTMDDGR